MFKIKKVNIGDDMYSAEISEGKLSYEGESPKKGEEYKVIENNLTEIDVSKQEFKFKYGLYEYKKRYPEGLPTFTFKDDEGREIIMEVDEYKVLNANMSQQILKLVDRSFKSFFGLLSVKGNGSYKSKVKLPNYIDKDGYFSLIIGEFSLKDNKFNLPMRNNYKNKRNNIINDYILKSCRYIVEYCKSNDIGNIVLGFNSDMTRNLNLGKVNNQKITNLPMRKIRDTSAYMCKWENIELHIQEESYTSKSSFWDKDPISKCNYSGKRVKRGLYKTGKGTLINADINGALNILRKSKVVDLETLYCRGEVDTPQRIRLI